MNDLITISINNESKQYKLLFIYEHKYVIYTDLNNDDISKNIYVIKLNSLDKNEKNIPITAKELEVLENKYQELLKNKNA